MYTYTQLEELAARVVRELAAERQKIDNARAQFAASETVLTNMQNQYGDWATEVNALAAANPDDPAIQALKAKRDLIIAEFGDTSVLATSLRNAVDAV